MKNPTINQILDQYIIINESVLSKLPFFQEMVIINAKLTVILKKHDMLDERLVDSINSILVDLIAINKLPGIIEAKVLVVEEKTEARERSQTSQAANKPKLPVANVKKIIAVASGKGGVGKSTIAAHLALAASNKGLNVALVDADIYGPSIPHIFNIHNFPEIENNLLVPHQFKNLKLMSIGFLVDQEKAAIWRGPMVTKTLYQLIRGVDWGRDGKEIDLMIIDLPPGTGDIHLSLLESYPVEGFVYVTTPQKLSIADISKAIAMGEKMNVPNLGLIVNMVNLFDKEYLLNIAVQKKWQIIYEMDFDKDIAEQLINKNLIENLQAVIVPLLIKID
ncbi:P-loop NTPase [Rickettsiales endosymbiont of Stachyamoeba lipophora]|uniref:P-loop NTPase n=1 Tax=Rickettsiales endosymbiont of Stachyamoeba lipophora TaxID=2486578 RepID=UPI000F64F47C|nr:P-loop NTPase [Rickettsiales endosymbiont of Stachyamoeba lipophora]AZL15337.1 sodium:proton antiporter [Rickettsiales endosymbiont of Stachyamoeba lipophora]